ncbi:lactate racemase domain-containing protein [Paenibacillus thalictri]|uniref:DUF2088 domain-containing protein n=1 Tax=Paenibacillus thalictri TaxID=2527873 RepID=A0A4Q9DQD1_9BACL|nr:lactate racemase domain-containing protein [Paenibacillus thalictri]TBL76506.1 DUF2088 domain-containing protein [Paenibacillus thalictri]
MDVIESIVHPIPVPRMVKVKQHFHAPELPDVVSAVRDELQKSGVLERIGPGDRVAVAVGSRGIADLPILVKETIQAIVSRGGLPFVVPAMGSHGGATAEGQRDVLEQLGVTEPFIGAQIRATMEVVEIGRLPKGLPVYMDKHAYEADKIVVIARIKPHTAFSGSIESGLCKMVAIGLGKQKGAEAAHAYSFKYMAEHVPDIARISLSRTPIVFGLGVIENAYDHLCKVVAVPAERFLEVEPQLLLEAKARMPRILFDSFDVLVINELGKDISGSGIDPHITGRFPTPYASGGAQVKRIAVLGLTPKTHGNANGIGLADVTTRKVFEETVWEKGFANALTSTVSDVVRMPMFLNTAEQAVKAAIKLSNVLDFNAVRLVRIRNTLQLGEIWISESMLEEAKTVTDLEIIGEPEVAVW